MVLNACKRTFFESWFIHLVGGLTGLGGAAAGNNINTSKVNCLCDSGRHKSDLTDWLTDCCGFHRKDRPQWKFLWSFLHLKYCFLCFWILFIEPTDLHCVMFSSLDATWQPMSVHWVSESRKQKLQRDWEEGISSCDSARDWKSQWQLIYSCCFYLMNNCQRTNPGFFLSPTAGFADSWGKCHSLPLGVDMLAPEVTKLMFLFFFLFFFALNVERNDDCPVQKMPSLSSTVLYRLSLQTV